MAKAKTKTKNGADRSDTQYMPGVGPEKNQRVHDAAKRYMRLRDKRIAANVEEKEAHDTLLGVMTEEKLEYYKYQDIEVAIDAKKKCKVAKPDPEGGSGDSDDDAGEE